MRHRRPTRCCYVSSPTPPVLRSTRQGAANAACWVPLLLGSALPFVLRLGDYPNSLYQLVPITPHMMPIAWEASTTPNACGIFR
jgi:hypothetical protein